MTRKRRWLYFLLAVGATLLALVLYTVYDNQRIVVRRETVFIENLPEAFNGFTILQLTDLHEKTFGPGQKRLIDVINRERFDLVAITGDMTQNSGSQNFQPFYDLLDGWNNRAPILFVVGNTDPIVYAFWHNHEKTPFYTGMEARGARLLESVFLLEKGEDRLWIVHAQDAMRNPEPILAAIAERLPAETDEGMKGEFLRQQKVFMDFRRFHADARPRDVVIGLTHYPLLPEDVERVRRDGKEFLLPPFDLLLAGHYHGGQIRLPFIGALYVPERRLGKNGYFPPQDRVKGWMDVAGIPQYVSAGLGARNSVPLLAFRLFNPPEINLITLKPKPATDAPGR
ncbi:metallophosphoesterase [Calditerricola satsumensis]|uniref:Calcineurin-like phosphoesterase domain-containing protein n=1 Tax=Calditerricola satsumensis TaxID=373054 RepID=A0A8J3BAM1_9BACI|nr:metallophosphoesterase [Calditerricola satsumensis]GGK01094.1 hypothetical protein GCM10007043_13970 [Calditerricola satsumensis]